MRQTPERLRRVLWLLLAMVMVALSLACPEYGMSTDGGSLTGPKNGVEPQEIDDAPPGCKGSDQEEAS